MCRRLDTVVVKPIANALRMRKGISPQHIVRRYILHDILLEVMKHVIEWTERVVQKHKRLGVLDNLCENMPPDACYRPPQKPYRQVMMWSGVEMQAVNRVLLPSFTAALRRTTDAGSLSPAAQSDCNIAIRCVRGITNFYLIVHYHRHTYQTISYMQKYVQEFHQFVHIFSVFRATQADRKQASKAAKELADCQTRQATIVQYFTGTATQRRKQRAVDTQGRKQPVHNILQQETFNVPKLHLLTHYGAQIQDFGNLLQYCTKIIESVHKLLKDAYRGSNRVDTSEQILHTTSRDYAMRIRALHSLSCSGAIEVRKGIL